MVHQSQSSTFSYPIHLLFFSSQIKKTLTRMITFINECWKSSFLNRVKTDHQDWVRLILSLWSVKLKLKSSGSRIEPCGAPCEMFVYILYIYFWSDKTLMSQNISWILILSIMLIYKCHARFSLWNPDGGCADVSPGLDLSQWPLLHPQHRAQSDMEHS